MSTRESVKRYYDPATMEMVVEGRGQSVGEYFDPLTQEMKPLAFRAADTPRAPKEPEGHRGVLPRQIPKDIGGVFKDDAGKAPVYQGFLAYFPRAIKEVAKVSAYGKEKYNAEYSDKGFLKLDSVRYADAGARHLLDEIIEGTVINAADGDCRHDAQGVWDALARLEIRLREEESKEESKEVQLPVNMTHPASPHEKMEPRARRKQ